MNTLLLGLAFSLAAPSLKEQDEAAAAIVGEWKVESTTVGDKTAAGGLGSPLEKEELRIEITLDGKWIPRQGKRKFLGSPYTLKLDTKADPKRIDIDNGKPENPQRAGALAMRTGIWKVDGDLLTIYFAAAGEERPKSFEPDKDHPGMKVVFRRIKPSDAAPKK